MCRLIVNHLGSPAPLGTYLHPRYQRQALTTQSVVLVLPVLRRSEPFSPCDRVKLAQSSTISVQSLSSWFFGLRQCHRTTVQIFPIAKQNKPNQTREKDMPMDTSSSSIGEVTERVLVLCEVAFIV